MQMTSRRHTQKKIVIVARWQWLVSNGTHEDENTLVVLEQLYFDKQLYCNQ